MRLDAFSAKRSGTTGLNVSMECGRGMQAGSECCRGASGAPDDGGGRIASCVAAACLSLRLQVMQPDDARCTVGGLAQRQLLVASAVVREWRTRRASSYTTQLYLGRDATDGAQLDSTWQGARLLDPSLQAAEEPRGARMGELFDTPPTRLGRVVTRTIGMIAGMAGRWADIHLSQGASLSESPRRTRAAETRRRCEWAGGGRADPAIALGGGVVARRQTGSEGRVARESRRRR